MRKSCDSFLKTGRMRTKKMKSILRRVLKEIVIVSARMVTFSQTLPQRTTTKMVQKMKKNLMAIRRERETSGCGGLSPMWQPLSSYLLLLVRCSSAGRNHVRSTAKTSMWAPRPKTEGDNSTEWLLLSYLCVLCRVCKYETIIQSYQGALSQAEDKNRHLGKQLGSFLYMCVLRMNK